MQATTQGRTPAGRESLRIPGTAHHTGRHRGSGRTDQRAAQAAPVRSPLCAFLNTQFLPSVEVRKNDRTGITSGEYRELYDAVQKDAVLSGLPTLSWAPDSDPERGLALLTGHLQAVDPDVYLYLDEDEEYGEGNRFHLFREQVLTDGMQTYLLPLRPTYEKMSPAFGRLVRRFIRAFADHGGVAQDEENSGPMAYMEEWIRDWASGEMCELEEEEMTQARYALSQYSKQPGTPGSKLHSFRRLKPLTPTELRAYRPKSDAEREMHTFLLRGERFLTGPGLDILSYAEYADQRFMDDGIDFCISKDLYFGIVWDDSDYDPVKDKFIEFMNNDLESGAEPQRFVLRDELGSVGRQDTGSHPVRLYLNYWEELTDRLTGYIDNSSKQS